MTPHQPKNIAQTQTTKAFGYILLVLISFLFPCNSYAQKTDSLRKVIESNALDTNQVKALLKISDYYYISDPDTTIVLCKQALKLSQRIGYKKGVSESLGYLAYLYNVKGEVKKALEYNEKSLELMRDIGTPEEISVLLNNLGYMYKKLGRLEDALKCYDESLKIREEMNDYAGMAASLNNLGLVYDNQGEQDKAIEYYHKSYEYFLQAKDTAGITYALNNIGAVFTDLKIPDSSLAYYREVIKLKKLINDRDGLALTYLNVALVHKMNISSNLDSTYYYTRLGLDIAKEIGAKKEIASGYSLLSYYYRTKKEYTKSIQLGEKAYKLAKELGYPEDIKEAANNLHYAYIATGNWRKAYEMHQVWYTMKDSLFNEKTEKAALTQELKHEYEKEKALAEKDHEKKLALQKEKSKAQNAIAEEQKSRQRIVIFSISGVLILIVIFTVIILRRLKITREQKSIIEEQNEELYQYNEEISAQRDQIETQKEALEEQQREIISSINYAKRIQTALFTAKGLQQETILNHWILFKPRDIVSGDFYWVRKKGNYGYIAAVDCTGHGVPGSLMSMLGVAFLNEIVSENASLNAGQILDRLREKVILELDQTGDAKDTKDGMDMSLIKFDCRTIQNESFTIEFAGANNPGYLARNGEIIEIKPDKQPIGFRIQATNFTNQLVELKKRDRLFIFSDGYWDQFGGSNNKKIGRRRFKEFLLGTIDLSNTESAKYMEQKYNEWKGYEEQIDDVLVIGITV